MLISLLGGYQKTGIDVGISKVFDSMEKDYVGESSNENSNFN